MNVDAPIEGTESSPDRLNRTAFANRLAKVLLASPADHGFAMSLEGPWGYGKTSVLNLMERAFEQSPGSERPLLLRFNPWVIGSHEKLVQSFLVQLAAKVEVLDAAEVGKKVARELLAYSSVFQVLKLIPGAEPLASVVATTIRALGGAAQKISELKELDLERRKRAVIDALSTLNQRIVVFIDDLDRLPASEVFEMIRLVKAVGNFPGLSYVLCYDPKYITSALAEVGISSAAAYLDKIIQLRVSLPSISKADVAPLINAEWDSFPHEARNAFPGVGDRVQELYFEALRFLLETPRDVKRVFNRLRMSEAACRGEVNMADLLGLEVLAVKAPSVYDQVRGRPELYVGEREDRSVYGVFHEPKPDDLGKARDSALEGILEPIREHIRALISLLFPLTASEAAFESESRSAHFGRISSKERLSAALAWGVPTEEFPYSLAKDFVTTPESRNGVARDALNQNKLRKFLDQLQTAIDGHAPADTADFCGVLARLADAVDASDATARADGVLGSAARQIAAMIEATLNSMEPDRRLSILTSIVKDEKAYSVGTLLVVEARRQHGLHGGQRQRASGDRWCNESELRGLHDLWIRATRNLSRSGDLFRAMELGPAMFLAKTLDTETAIEIGSNALANVSNFDSMALRIAYKGTDSVNGRYACVEPAFFEPFGDPTQFRATARERLMDPAVTGEIRNSILAIAKGSAVYLKDGTDARQ